MSRPRLNTYADVMSLPVEYAGRNPVGQHLFKNGSPLVTDVYDTLESAVERFGNRIQTYDKRYRLSHDWKAGNTATSYSPPEKTKKQENMEYALGYIRRLIDANSKPQTARATVIETVVKPAIITPAVTAEVQQPPVTLQQNPMDVSRTASVTHGIGAGLLNAANDAARRRGRPRKVVP